jgi:lipoate-protein ligase B
LLAAHPLLITVGRAGSRSHILATGHALERMGLAVRWVNRGGGCILHAPGQLGVYPIVPLDRFGWNVGQYLARLSQAVASTLSRLGILAATKAHSLSAWGRTGQLAGGGIIVRRGMASDGFHLNVEVSRPHLKVLDSPAAPLGTPTRFRCWSSLVAEQGRPVRMSGVRAALVESLAAALSCPDFQPVIGHPWLPRIPAHREPHARAT